MTRISTLASAAAMLAFAGTATALNIDDFNGGDDFISVTPATPVPQSSNTAYGGAVGGSRTLNIATADGNGPSNEVAGGTWNIGNPPGAGSTGSVVWNANAAGLGGVDVTDGGVNDALELAILAIDVGSTTLTFSLTDTSGSTSSLTLPGLGIGEKTFLFSSFTGSANLASIDSIVLAYETGENTDLEIDLIRTRPGTSVPLPGTLALLGIGLLGLRVRRHKTDG